MDDARFMISPVGNSQTWVVVDEARGKQLVASSPNVDCARMIAALMNGDLVQAVQYRDDLLKTSAERLLTGRPRVGAGLAAAL